VNNFQFDAAAPLASVNLNSFIYRDQSPSGTGSLFTRTSNVTQVVMNNPNVTIGLKFHDSENIFDSSSSANWQINEGRFVLPSGYGSRWNLTSGYTACVTIEGSSGSCRAAPLVFTGGPVSALGTITPGSGYTNGTYNGVLLTGGSGTGAAANIVVSGGVVTSVTLSAIGGYITSTGATGYHVGDVLSASTANLGGTGSGFSIPVNSIGGYAWTPPIGMTEVEVKACGGGGGGGGGALEVANVAASGGAGGAAAGCAPPGLTYSASSLGSTINILVGEPGAGGAAATVSTTAGTGASNGNAT